MTGTLRLSPIMNWYAKDFGGSDREVLESIAPYLPDQVTRQRPRAGGLRARYLDYNWNLNEQTAPPIPPATATADSGAHTEDPD